MTDKGFQKLHSSGDLWSIQSCPNFLLRNFYSHDRHLFISILGYAYLMAITWIVILVPCFLTHWGRGKMAAIFADDIFKCIF